MFTGLVLKTARFISLNRGKPPVLTLETDLPNDVKIGDSVAVNGACLTLISSAKNHYKFNLSNETIKLSNFGDISAGSLVNIELPLRLNDFIGGHLVSGHLDGTVRVRDIRKNSDSTKISFLFQEKEWKKFIIHKGSVTLNGVSLTVSEKGDSYFSVDIIPHTLSSTNLINLRKGERVNIELDMIAKYIYNINTNK